MTLSPTRIALIAGLALTAGAGVALAKHHGDGEHGKPRIERMFERIDTDNDGRISGEDMRAAAAARFARRDADGNGIVSRDEQRDWRQTRRAERRAARFQAMDTDGDGMLSEAEFTEAKGMKRRGGKHRMGTRRAGRGPLTIQEAEARALRRFERMDANGDGIVTLEEAKASKPRRHRRG